MSGRLLLILLVTATLPVGCGGSGELERDVRRLESTSPDTRRESALELGRTRIVEGETRARLVRRLSVMAQSDPDPLTRSAALMALTTQDTRIAVDVAKRLRTDADAMVRCDAVKVLAAHGDASTVGALIEIAEHDPDEQTRREAVKALGKYDRRDVITTLITHLEDSSLAVAHAAHDALVGLSAGVDFGMNVDAWRKWHE